MEPTPEAVQEINVVEPKGSTEAAAQRLDSMMAEPPPEDEAPSTVEEPEEVKEPEPEKVPEAEPKEPTSEDVVTHFSELAEHLGVEEDFLDTLIVPTKINGEERTATIHDLVTSFQKGESADQKFMELADKRKTFDAELEQTKTALQQEWSRAQALNTELQNMLGGTDDASIQELRHTDPAEYAARMAERQQQIQKATQIQAQLGQENALKVNDQYTRRLTSERSKLLQVLPEWADEKTMEKENTELRGYLKSVGLGDEEIDGRFDPSGNLLSPGIIDHRAIVMARKAMLYDQSKKQTEPKKKKLKALPKVGSGKPRGKGEVNTAKQKSMRERAKSSGSVDDAALIIQQIMEG
jgi:hypothetical protein